MKQSEIIIKNMQIKSIEKLKILSKNLDELEKELGIHQVKITIQDTFICPDIEIDKLDIEQPMNMLLVELINGLRG